MSNPSRKIAHLPKLVRGNGPSGPGEGPGRGADGPVRVAVLGVGEMGRRHVRVFSGEHGFEVVGIVDASPAVADAVAREHDVPRLHDAAEAIARAELVVVATPITSHRVGVETALGASRHVLVEKPICATVAEAERLVLLARLHGGKLFVGHSERFNPVVRALVERVAPSRVLALDFWREGPPRGARRSDDGVLLNLGVHDIDLVALLGGGPATLRRAEGNEARALLTLQAHNGALARVRVDRNAPVRKRALTLTTADHVYEGDLLAPRLIVTPRSGGKSEEISLDPCEPLLAQARALHDALHGLPATLATGLDGARALSIAERAAHLTTGPLEAPALGVAAGKGALAEKL
jgi:UDP-N-acetylglucosamine 3-dehydrogenase